MMSSSLTWDCSDTRYLEIVARNKDAKSQAGTASRLRFRVCLFPFNAWKQRFCVTQRMTRLEWRREKLFQRLSLRIDSQLLQPLPRFRRKHRKQRHQRVFGRLDRQVQHRIEPRTLRRIFRQREGSRGIDVTIGGAGKFDGQKHRLLEIKLRI